MSAAARALPARHRLSSLDLARVAAVAFRTRRLRAILAILGVAIGSASLVGVLGISQSSQAGLLSELNRLGTNLLEVQPGQALPGQAVSLPLPAGPMLRRVGPVQGVVALENLPVDVYRSELVPGYATNAINVYTTDLELLKALDGTVRTGAFLNAVTARFPVVVLGSDAARRLGIDRFTPGLQVAINGQRFSVAGILNPLELTPDLDSAALIGRPAGARLLHATGHASIIFVRTDPNAVAQAQAVLGQTANPADPGLVAVSRPSDALKARAAANQAFSSLVVGLTLLALVVGGIGIANVMVIGVLERRSEIGLRRSLGASQRQIGAQFLSESLLLGGAGGFIGVLAGALLTTIYALAHGWSISLSPLAVVAALGASLLIGTLAGLYPAIAAARLSPTEALRST